MPDSRSFRVEATQEKLPSNLSIYLVLGAVMWLLMGPRLPLVTVAGSSIRVEDLVLILLWIYVLIRWRSLSMLMPKRRIAGIAIVGLSATIFAVVAGRVSFGPAILYSMRPLEYWAVFPAVYFTLRRSTGSALASFQKVLIFVTYVQVGVAALQSLFGFDLGFSKFSIERGAGLTAGPYELGAICSMLGVYWFFKHRYLLAVIATLGVFLSASRISVLGLAAGIVISFLARRKAMVVSDRRNRKFLAVGASLIGILAAGTFILVSPMSAQQLGSPVVDRLQDTSTLDAWSESGKFASGLTLPENAEEYDLLAYGNMPYLLGQGGFATGVSGEASDMVRFFRWHLLIDLLNDPAKTLFGLGPSYAGASVDGSYLRMLAETGLIGLVAWFVCIRSWVSSSDSAMFGAIIALLVGAVFIDVVYSLRTMVLVWALLAYGDAVCAGASSISRTYDHFPKRLDIKNSRVTYG